MQLLLRLRLYNRAVTDRLRSPPAVGIGYRWAIDNWLRHNLDRFDVLEVTVDNCIYGRPATRAAIFDLVGRVPMTAHGVGLSIGTDEPLDRGYLDHVAEVVKRLDASCYSEHLAFTRVPGRDLGNLLPLPRTAATACSIIAKVRQIQSHIPVPFLLENIAYVFDWPDSVLSHAEFFKRICGQTGAGILLDVENLYANAQNHGVDARAFLNALPAGIVAQVHIAGGVTVREPYLRRPFFADTHDQPISGDALDLLAEVLARQAPSAVILERDARLEFPDEILDDIARIRARLKEHAGGNAVVAAPD